jgi:BirA family biotin operon repressor/biotin-[acetyl-CoA-carboxylase] ligase
LDRIPLAASTFATHLQTRFLGRELQLLDEVDSTNLEAMRQARKGVREGLVIIADRQTSGRGRRNRHWHSFGNESLAMSVLLRPEIDPVKVSQLSLVAAVAVHQALSRFAPDVRIKWPNDILHRGKKLAGILTEMQSDLSQVQAVVVGIGINLHAPAHGWPEDIKDLATDLTHAAGKDSSRLQVVLELITCLEETYLTYLQKGFEPFRKRWWQAHAANGRSVRIRYGGDDITGVARALDEQGRLVIETKTGTHRVLTGEVEILQ